MLLLEFEITPKFLKSISLFQLKFYFLNKYTDHSIRYGMSQLGDACTLTLVQAQKKPSQKKQFLHFTCQRDPPPALPQWQPPQAAALSIKRL